MSMRRSLALLAALVLSVIPLLTVVTATPAAAASGGWGSRINDYRAQNGLSGLTEDASLSAVAQAWTQKIALTGTLAHNSALPQQVKISWTRLGENVGVGYDEASLFRGFVNSPGHRANLLGAYNAVGIGQVVSGGRLWTTHVFVATTADLHSPAPTVTAAARATGGMWSATGEGRVTAIGGAPHLGQLTVAPNRAIVGMSGTPTGNGYWLVAADGGVFAFGDARFHGSTGGLRLNKPVVGMAPTPTGRGYWLVAADGGIFAFGDARFHGSTGGLRLNSAVVGMSATPTGRGYWLVAADGGIFAFGDAGFYGSTGSLRLAAPVVGITSSVTGRGYRLVASDGGIFSFGDAAFYGSLGGAGSSARVAGMAATPDGGGYWLQKADGSTAAFGNAARA